MAISEIDFYFGFEREREFGVVSSGPAGTSRVRLWEGHFDTIMSHVQPGPDGWRGLALQ
jgi:hypothetical protein